MFFPIHTDRRLKRTPWVNYTLIGLNVVIFLMTRTQVESLDSFTSYIVSHHIFIPYQALIQKFPIQNFYLSPDHFHYYQLITYQFLHAGWMHIIGNMIFLYVFGNGVEDRLGKVGYTAFYLIGGIIAGLGHSLLVANPVIGASGAIAAVTGAYLALFPLSKVTIIWFLIIIFPLQISSIYLILAEVGLNLFYQISGGGHVAYIAHLSGYVFGFAVGLTLLLSRILSREPYDILTLIEQRQRRSRFKRMAKSGYQPWEGQASAGFGKKKANKPPSKEQQQMMDLRQQISSLLQQHDAPAAAELYGQLLAISPTQVMGEQAQMAIANQLMNHGQYQAAASAYELFIKTYKTNTQKPHVQLILSLIYARYLNNPQRVKALLDEACPHLSGSDLQLAEQLQDENK